MNKLSSFLFSVHLGLSFSFFSPSPIFAATQRSELSVENLFNKHVDSIVVIGALDKKGSQLGSGFIIKEDGVIVTNAHLMNHASKIVVKLRKSQVYHEARLVSVDWDKDIAILKINAKDLKPVKLGNSSKVQTGQRVVTIGNPLGLENTISDGLISSLRSVKGGFKVLQTSVPLSQGSSGGPLFNLEGEVVGITTGSYLNGQNLNFAIPINYVKSLLAKSNYSKTTSNPVFSKVKGKRNNVYIVQPRDTLAKIARRFCTTVSKLKQLNGLNDSKIQSGQKIKIPAK